MPFKYSVIPPQPGEMEIEGKRLSRPFRQFLFNRVSKGLDLKDINLREGYPPSMMEGVDEAVKRLVYAIRKGERIMLHGDYDADGLTALAIMFRALKWLKADVVPFVPERYEGYGLLEKGVNYAKRIGAKLILTLDCGVSSYYEIEMAKRYDIDVIVADHHRLPPKLPDAIIVHPELGDYPYRDLTGAGVALKLVRAIFESMGVNRNYIAFLSDLAAVGTVGDVGSMLGENRLIVDFGMKMLNRNWGEYPEGLNKGLRAIAEKAGLGYPLNEWHIAWVIAPRINAAGRMGNVNLARDLLISEDRERVRYLASELEELNRRRQMKQRENFEIAKEVVDPSSPVAFAVSGAFDAGVAGIVASKLMEEFGKPAVVVSVANGRARGSIRSLEPFNTYDALVEASDLFSEEDHYGGHALAGGFSISSDRLDALKRRIEEYALKVSVGGEFPVVVQVDAELRSEEMDADFWRDMKGFRPYGQDFPPPVFLLQLRGYPSTEGDVLEHFEGGRHFRLYLKNPNVNPKGDLVVTSLHLKNGIIYGEVISSL